VTREAARVKKSLGTAAWRFDLRARRKKIHFTPPTPRLLSKRVMTFTRPLRLALLGLLVISGCSSDDSSAPSAGGAGSLGAGGSGALAGAAGTGTGGAMTADSGGGPGGASNDGQAGASNDPDGGVVSGDAGPSSGIEHWHPVDLTFNDPAGSGMNVAFSATFTGPGGETLIIPGFQVGPGTWKIRFAPTAQGNWSYKTTAPTAASLNGQTGTLHCTANTNKLVHGRLGVDANNSHHFRYEDGTPYFMLGFDANWLGLLDLGDVTIPKAKSLIDMYASHGFSEVLMNVYAHDTTWTMGHTSNDDFGPPSQYAWKGSNGAPDHTQLNLAFFESYDRVIAYLFDHGVVAHIMIKVYNKLVNWPQKGSSDDDLYFGHVVARYQAYPNVIWDFAKESNNEPDIAYKTGRINFIRGKDAYHRLLTTHTDEGYYASGAVQGILDFRTDQTHNAWYDTIIARRNAAPWPVFNSEYGYEQGNDGGHTYNVFQDKQTVFKRACEILMAGGYPGYYYTYHAWDLVRYAELPAGLGYYKNLSDLFAKTRWYDLAPHDDLIDNPAEGRRCLAKPGAEYVVYLAGAGTVALNVQGIPNGGTLAETWVDLISGQQRSIGNQTNGSLALTNPWAGPAMLHLGQ
jgi:Protein of unknown function (DUF4038)/Domain of unknown function (DUF5060)